MFFLLFSISFALIESVVVIYLRLLFYPEGFAFPLKMVPTDILGIELFREAATLLLLVSVAWLAGSCFYSRLAWFLIAFGVWDIFYYIWLKLLLNWPASFLTWYLLFLIPIPWVAPVLSPLLVSVTFIILGGMILYLERQGRSLRITLPDWMLLMGGVMLILVSYIYEHARRLYSCEEFMICATDYVPTDYNWILFLCGEVLMLMGAYRSLKKCSSS